MRKVRTREPFRRQGVMRFEMPEDSLAEDHRARLSWQVVETLDLSAFTVRAKAVEGRARVMKMPDGGFRPGYNVQLATAGSPMGGSRTIVGVRVTSLGSDLGSVTPMLDQIERRTGQLPKTLMADANHAKHDCIVGCAGRGVEALTWLG